MNVSSSEDGGTSGQRFSYRNGPKPWSVVALSVLGSACAVSAAGAVCAFIYPVLRELRTETVRGEDGTEVRILGFWSILVLSVLAGWLCWAFSWTLTYLDSYKPSGGVATPLALSHLRQVPDQGFHMDYSVAVLNGIMAMLTVIWTLS
ncbi:ADP-ribosylation factor-like protein 6-interacting protein 6 [Myripristis murdjan]|uniref:ADP-ribosylation factor-like protein 6-interacting protein 6 n=1 Tax=Myripristis murdjan TaxID=586833 RepID=A0A667XTN5_9TELE|nr:ADP-ribosylation factor-like protein 6-interacting protein 6 [Myripristis murdjan]